MTDATPAEALVAEALVAAIQVRARAVLEDSLPSEEKAAVDFDQFTIGSYFGGLAAMQVLRECGAIRDVES